MTALDERDAYLEALPPERQDAVRRLLDTLRHHLPEGFEETMAYGMPAFVVPHSRYPDGYHCDPEQPLPFVSVANQKGHVGLYHMGIYADPDLLDWFQTEWPNHVPTKLDMGKACIRFKRMDRIPYDLVAQLAERVTPDDWIERYEAAVKR
ncbi:MAG: DUF1801 domain-containing protein [Rubricoccaceae bacterium]|nr:DUF1801 domain-containing protein [Rubricoccaceae bacterium]